ncbi:MAG TPA: bifunctional adenosylcobinamide kinase/adenosylcobinamide-phosphate guanylyltransferase [Bryobacteraceae bacterium]|nr:bifunctional adenosylcobinamide kinase/adenosylcobinamide-phosphate guanylyltransferase [Bryobacteraceae bacterium]
MLTLVLGGARSGKSRFAQSLCAGGERVAYIATARPEDDEMVERIERHRRNRSSSWLSVEEPLAIADAVERCARDCDFILLDCLTVWLSNVLWAHRTETSVERLRLEAAKHLTRLPRAARSTNLVVVTNEVGSGVVPVSDVGRRFRDLQGWLNQDAAALADSVYLVVAGIPLRIKPREAGA